MLSGHIEGKTRTIGERQGYHGLDVRDELVYCTVNGPNTPVMVTAWEPTPQELKALNDGASVRVCIMGTVHPPINVSVGPLPE